MRAARFVTLGAIAALVLLLFALLGTTLVTILAAAVGAVVAVLVFREQRDGAAPEAATAPPEESVPDWVASARRLARLNFEMRAAGAPGTTLSALEPVIDQLRELLPELGEEHVGTELAWTVDRMASDYLPRVVDPWLRLAPPEREQREAELLRSLTGLRSELDSLTEIVNARRLGDFQTKAAFLRARFLEPDGP